MTRNENKNLYFIPNVTNNTFSKYFDEYLKCIYLYISEFEKCLTINSEK